MSDMAAMFSGKPAQMPKMADAVRMPDIEDPAVKAEAERKRQLKATSGGRESTNLTTGTGSGSPVTYGNAQLGS